ncbi:hypothetical protein KSS87_002209 [Heliosperma pusillum]|nr:hypothetical protein KSS87_002209 [Heliosperma pusillum]
MTASKPPCSSLQTKIKKTLYTIMPYDLNLLSMMNTSVYTDKQLLHAKPAAAFVAQEESWRRIALWERVQDFRTFTGIGITSHIVSIVVGSEEKSLLASRHMLDSGFHVTAIRPPTVPPNSCRLRITLSATHKRKDVKKLAAALSRYINFQDVNHENAEILAKL